MPTSNDPNADQFVWNVMRMTPQTLETIRRALSVVEHSISPCPIGQEPAIMVNLVNDDLMIVMLDNDAQLAISTDPFHPALAKFHARCPECFTSLLSNVETPDCPVCDTRVRLIRQEPYDYDPTIREAVDRARRYA